MTFALKYKVDLHDEALSAYAQDVSNVKPWQPNYTAPLGYEVSGIAPIVVGTAGQKTVGSPVKLVWSERRYFNVIEGKRPATITEPAHQGQIVGNFDAVVPYSQEIQIEILALLLVSSSASAAQRVLIENKFSGYKYEEKGEPEAFVDDTLKSEPSLTRDLFLVDFTHRVIKMSSANAHEDQLQALLAVYEGRATGAVYMQDGAPQALSDPGYFPNNGLSYQFLRSETTADIPPPPIDYTYKKQNSLLPVVQVVMEVIRNEGAQLECDQHFKSRHWKIMTLLRFPEFMLKWQDVRFKLGCVWVVLTLPVIHIRISDLNLYAYVRQPESLTNVEQVVMACVFRAALSGAVVGVALGNIMAALHTFRAIFSECIKEKLLMLYACLLPGLMLIGENQPGDDWHPL